MRIRRGLSSRVLPCGCLAGIYETYSEEIVVILDAKNVECRDSSHVDGNVIPSLTRDRPRTTQHTPQP